MRVIAADDAAVAPRLLADRRDALGVARSQTINRLHRLLLELLPDGAKKFLSATQARELLAGVSPHDIAGKTRRRQARHGSLPSRRMSGFPRSASVDHARQNVMLRLPSAGTVGLPWPAGSVRQPKPAVLSTVPATSMAACILPARVRNKHPDAALSLRTATGLNHYSTTLAPEGAAHLSLMIAPTLP